MEKQEFRFSGYGVVEKVAANGGNSARVFVPKAWAGKKVVAVLLESLDEKE
jgi:putative transposon-encoded protein